MNKMSRVRCQENSMNIQNKILWKNRDGNGTSFFHPRACMTGNGELLMIMQSISGSDFYGPLLETVSPNRGETWTAPRPIPSLGWKELPEGLSEGICDAVPEFHAPTGTVLLIGHNVYYRDGHLTDTLGDFGNRTGGELRRFPVWSVRDRSGEWIHTRQKLPVPKFEECSFYSCGSSQRLFLRDDELLVPLVFGYFGRRDRMFCSARFRYDGENLDFLELGSSLELPIGRGYMEPSLALWNGIFYVTLRTEDGFGHYATSSDGLQWGNPGKWVFDDGEALVMTNTQQHWLTFGGKLFLVYHRKTEENGHLFRYRAPLFIAEVDGSIRLKRNTEQIVFPLIDENRCAAGTGNFQTTVISDTTALITVGEERSFDHFRGDTLAAFISLQQDRFNYFGLFYKFQHEK